MAPTAVRSLISVALVGCGPAKTEPGSPGRPPADAVHSEPRPAMTITVDHLKTWSDQLARSAGGALRAWQGS
jgi:hypothetical protein